jgi:hypothetical protein
VNLVTELLGLQHVLLLRSAALISALVLAQIFKGSLESGASTALRTGRRKDQFFVYFF